ncbi:(2Fe-2S)-binding protein [Mycobacterium dioxanotrophicus]|jgi:bacterioferritin-associated ferredoxin|uniref:Bacterioferritin-associated ferredoxin n=1 Tax=Mycobacterium dioxanotrophicus TaxID=482462 RepID=A0A1Y0C3X5_9MYCO|nr:(2Fe-2S)-binding protein [Mycobacterium dioxanotrophicus]ART69889.1 (2Fe-2S)-binding protein [Mycobacterium dioxanotrophicus]
MFVCLCTGVTSHVVNDVVAAGATTSKQIADACGAGKDCGRCRRTIRAIIAAHQANGCPTPFNGCPARTTASPRICGEIVAAVENGTGRAP